MDESISPGRDGGTDASPDGPATVHLTDRALQDLVGDVLEDPFLGEDRLDSCDAYVVLVADPATGALDSYGPFDGETALFDAARRRSDLDEGDLGDVTVTVVRHHLPASHAGPHALAS